jgi:hypothetical protein
VLKLPYHESDHVLNIAYNILAGRMRLEDSSSAGTTSFLNGLEAERIPDPTTAGTSRGASGWILALQMHQSQAASSGRIRPNFSGVCDVDVSPAQAMM